MLLFRRTYYRTATRTATATTFSPTRSGNNGIRHRGIAPLGFTPEDHSHHDACHYNYEHYHDYDGPVLERLFAPVLESRIKLCTFLGMTFHRFVTEGAGTRVKILIMMRKCNPIVGHYLTGYIRW
jgi:hypothetical protein